MAEPMGEIRKYASDTGYGITKWYPDRARLRRLRKRVQGPLQLGYWYRKYDRTGKYIYPSEKHVIKKYKNSYGDVVKIYNTDEERILDEVFNEYFMYRDLVDMLDVAQEKKIPEEKRIDKFLKRVYGDTTYNRIWCRKPDPVYD